MTNMPKYTDIHTFCHEGLTALPDDYYTARNTKCDICQETNTELCKPDGCAACSASIVRINHCHHIFHKDCLTMWIIRSLSDNGVATCPLCRATLVIRPQEVQLYIHANSTDEHMRQRLPQALLEEIEELNSRHRTDAEQYILAQKVIELAVIMIHLRMDVDWDVINSMSAYMAEYEKAHPLHWRSLSSRIFWWWYDVKVRSRQLLGLQWHSFNIRE
jgi:hypothetical protein